MLKEPSTVTMASENAGSRAASETVLPPVLGKETELAGSSFISL